MKKNRFLVALAAMALVASVFAQGGQAQGGPQKGAPGPKGGAALAGRGQRRSMLDMDQKILDGLKLNKDQTSKVKALKSKIGDKMKALREKFGGPGGPGGPGRGPGGPGGNPGAAPGGRPGMGGPGGRPGMASPEMAKRREAMMAVRKEYTDGLAKILTKAQMDSYNTQMKAEMEKMRAQWGGGRGPGGPGAGGPRP